MNAEIEDTSAIVLGPEGFPLWSYFSSDVPTPDPAASTGAEFEEFSTVVAYEIQSRVIYGKLN